MSHNARQTEPRHGAPDIHRTLPHSLEAEQGVLGSMLIAPTDVIGEFVKAGVSEAWFYQPAHATLYAILVECWNAQKPADVITLTHILRERHQLDEIGGPAAVTHLFTFTPTAANASYYREIVAELVARRARSVAYIKSGWVAAAQFFGTSFGGNPGKSLASQSYGTPATSSRPSATAVNLARGATEIGGPALQNALDHVGRELVPEAGKRLAAAWNK